MTTIESLLSLNFEIGVAESRGDRAFFERQLAPVFAFRRADRETWDNRDSFLSKLEQSPDRDTKIDSVTLLGTDRAVVTSVVTMKMKEGDKAFRNARLFVLDGDRWLLLAWANEPAPKPAQ